MEFLRTPFLIELPLVAASGGYIFLGKKEVVIVFYFKDFVKFQENFI